MVFMWRVSNRLRIKTLLTLKESNTQFKVHATEFQMQSDGEFVGFRTVNLLTGT